MEFALRHDRRSITDSDLLSDLQRVAAQRSESFLKQRTYRELGQYGVMTVIRRFGSWNAAIEAAGLEKTVERNVADEELFSALLELWVRLGRQPSYSEVQQPDCRFHVATYERRFGSWRGALEAFVEYANFEGLTPPPASQNRESRKSHRSSRSIDDRLRFRVFLRDGFRCRACGASPAITPGVRLELDHVVAWSKGGETVIDNLQTFCSSCNQGKTNMDVV